MKMIKLTTLIIILSLFALTAIGCSWWGDEPEITVNEVESGFEDKAVVADAGDVNLTNQEELILDPSELVASEFDGFIDWSPDGKYLAVNMSNLTLASAQAMIVDAVTGETKAVIGGYNVRWDKSNPSDIIFTRHQYYGPPDYGSYEESIRVKQADLLAAEVFNDDISYEVIGENEISAEGLSWPCENVVADDRVICSDLILDDSYTILLIDKDGKTSLYAMPADGSIENDAWLLVDESLVVDSFTLNPDKTSIIFKVVSGEADEYGNLEQTAETTKFIKANIN